MPDMNIPLIDHFLLMLAVGMPTMLTVNSNQHCQTLSADNVTRVWWRYLLYDNHCALPAVPTDDVQ